VDLIGAPEGEFGTLTFALEGNARSSELRASLALDNGNPVAGSNAPHAFAYCCALPASYKERRLTSRTAHQLPHGRQDKHGDRHPGAINGRQDPVGAAERGGSNWQDPLELEAELTRTSALKATDARYRAGSAVSARAHGLSGRAFRPRDLTDVGGFGRSRPPARRRMAAPGSAMLAYGVCARDERVDSGYRSGSRCSPRW